MKSSSTVPAGLPSASHALAALSTRAAACTRRFNGVQITKPLGLPFKRRKFCLLPDNAGIVVGKPKAALHRTLGEPLQRALAFGPGRVRRLPVLYRRTQYVEVGGPLHQTAKPLGRNRRKILKRVGADVALRKVGLQNRRRVGKRWCLWKAGHVFLHHLMIEDGAISGQAKDPVTRASRVAYGPMH